MEELTVIRTEHVQRLDLKPGDVLHISVGGMLEGSDFEPWIPSPEDLEYYRDAWESVIPEGVKVFVTHCLVTPTIIHNDG